MYLQSSPTFNFKVLQELALVVGVCQFDGIDFAQRLGVAALTMFE
jgi:hypothetical protein